MKITEVYNRYRASEIFRCPICHSPMAFKNLNSLVCANNHCFDLSKHGYINFAPGLNKNSTYTKNVYVNRRHTLLSGFYAPANDAIKQIIDDYMGLYPNIRVLDVGCGEGYFSSELMTNHGMHKDIYAMDIQKEAIILAAKNNKTVKWLIADLLNIPLKNHSIDVLLNIFAPANYDEFLRVLAPHGLIIKIIPGHRHLIELREYAEAQLLNKKYSNEPVLKLFNKHVDILDKISLVYRRAVSAAQLENLIQMTPLMFNIDKSILNFDVDSISFDFEILIGKFKS